MAGPLVMLLTPAISSCISRYLGRSPTEGDIRRVTDHLAQPGAAALHGSWIMEGYGKDMGRFYMVLHWCGLCM